MSRLPFPLFNKLSPTSSPNIMKPPSSFQFDDSDFFAPQTDSGMTFDSFGFDDANYYESTSSSLSSWEGHDSFQSPRSLSSLSDQRPSTGTHFDVVPIFDTHLESSIYPEHHDMPAIASEFDDSSYSCWVNDQDLAALAPTPAPISKCPSTSGSRDLPSFTPYAEFSYYSEGTFSPPDLVPPRLLSPEKTVEPASQFSQLDSISPRETSLQPPEWATQLWDDQKFHHPTKEPHQSGRPEFSHRSHKRHRYPTRRESPYLGHTLHSSSAPSLIQLGNHQERVRTYSNRTDSVDEDNDATIRRKKRVSAPDIKDVHPVDKLSDGPPSKSLLRPPKLAPSAWQLYFTDWISKQQASSSRKLNVAQAAKEAGQEYATLSAEEKEPYKRRSQAAKELRERELAAYMRTLTPEDIKRENVFRAAQRKAGKSRRSNIKDPNAPKKPLSAYFMFLQHIRAEPWLVQEVFGDETETTKQSVLAAARWRSMTDDERKPFLAQAEQEKLNYEAARRLYEQGTVSYGSSINFSILPRTEIAFPVSVRMKSDPTSSESDSDCSLTDDGMDNPIHS